MLLAGWPVVMLACRINISSQSMAEWVRRLFTCSAVANVGSNPSPGRICFLAMFVAIKQRMYAKPKDFLHYMANAKMLSKNQCPWLNINSFALH